MSDATNLVGTRRIEKTKLKDLAIQLGVVQREAKELGIPALVLIEGLDASEKGALLNQILLEMDSRAYEVYSTHASHIEPRAFPLLWRFWNHTPSRGRIQFYDRGPYYLVLDAWAEQAIREKDLGKYWSHIRNFERQLNDAGVAITKIFLTVPKKEQARRFKKLESNPKTAWRVSSKDWKRHKQYKPYMEQVSEMVKATGSPFASWEVIDTKDTRGATVKIYQTIIAKLESAIEQKKKEAQKTTETHWIPYNGKSYLSEAKFRQPMERSKYKQELKLRQQTIDDLVHEIYSKQIPVVLVYCGWDAAGKGGCIKRLVQGIDPRSYHVTPVGAPTSDELDHHYLWRFWERMPRRGRLEIFDRSWYGRVLVERVEKLCSNEEWQRAYGEINEMESHLSDYGTVIIKFWLHIDAETQFERFEARQENPLKHWKITDEDWRNREKWDLYEEAINEMISKTDKPHAPWTVVNSVCKMRARIQTLDTIIGRLGNAIINTKIPPL